MSFFLGRTRLSREEMDDFLITECSRDIIFRVRSRGEPSVAREILALLGQ